MLLKYFILSLATLTSLVTSNSLKWTYQDAGGVSNDSPHSDYIQNREASLDGVAGHSASHNAQSTHHQAYPASSANAYDTGSGHVVTQGGHVGQPTAYHYSIYPHYAGNYQHSAGNAAYPATPEGDGWLCRTFGGICDDGNNRQGYDNEAIGIAGGVLAGLKGLKLLKFLPFLPLLIPFLPLLLPLLLIIAIPVIIAAWFLPVVPVLVTGRRMAVLGARNVQETLLSEQCLERISCEVSKISRAYEFEAPWIKEFLDKKSAKVKWIERVTRAGRDAGSTGCDSFTCRPVTAFRKSLTIGS